MVTRLRGLVAAVATMLPLCAQAGDGPLFVEVDGVPSRVWLQQPVEWVVRIGYDAAWFATSSVPLFQQRLDQPFHVVVPWLLAAEDRAVELVAPAATASVQRLAVGDRVAPWVVAGTRRLGERTFALLELRCRWLPLAPGTAAVAPVQVRYAFATQFTEDFLRGRQALDRQEATVASAPASFPVMPLPLPAPAGFGGAVGEFVVVAACAQQSARVGESFPLLVEVTGEGNLDRFAPLAAPQLPGFHVQGVVERRTPAVRRFQLDVLPLRAGVTAVPPVPFVSFSPASGTYVTQHTPPTPLRVDAATAELPARIRELVDAEARAVAAAEAPSGWWALVAAAAVAAGTMGLRARRRRVARTAAIARARAVFAAVPVVAAPERLVAFEALLAVVAGELAWSEAVWPRLEAAGGEASQAPMRALHAALDAARFGGEAPTASAAASVLDAWLRGRR